MAAIPGVYTWAILSGEQHRGFSFDVIVLRTSEARDK